MDLVSLTAGCILSVADVEIEPVETGWEEVTTAEVLANGRCPYLDIVLPPDVTLEALKARVRLADGPKHKLDADRQRRLTRDVAGRGAIRLYTPELLTGDIVEIEIERHHPAMDWTFTPGSEPFEVRFASLASSVLPAEPPEGLSVDDDGFWVANPPASLALTLSHPDPEPTRTGPSPLTAADPPVQATRSLVLNVNGRDPMTALYPGGGSTVDVTWTVEWPEHEGDGEGDGESDRGWVLPIPSTASDVTIDGEHERRDDSVLLVARAGESPTHTVRWVEDDAPVYGGPVSLPNADVSVEVQMDGARIRWQDEPWGRAWWVGSLGMRRLVPDRSQLIRALDRRFRRAAIPEPAVPARLRGKAASWELLAALKPELATRAGVADLPVHPLFPRRLIKARRTGALTSVEASLILWLQALQSQVPAAWAIVHPADLGGGWHTSAAGYTEGVVAYQLDGETRFADPACTVCAPFEIRPELHGASMISPIGNRTPPPTEGAARIRDANGQRRVDLEGPAALTLRRTLASVPTADRERWIATRFGGPEGSVVEVDGLGDRGRPIRIVVASRTLPDPFSGLPGGVVPSDADSGWWIWLGERVWETEVTAGEDSDAPRRHVHEGSLCWTSERVGDRQVETLNVRSRRIAPDLAARVLDARTQPEVPAPAVDESGEPEESPVDSPSE